MRRHRSPQAQVHASPAFPSATGEQDGGMTLDGGATQARGAARKGAGCLAGRSKAGRAGHAGETSEQTLHDGEGAGKKECPAAGPCGDGVGRRCDEVKGLEQLRRTSQLEWRIFLFEG